MGVLDDYFIIRDINGYNKLFVTIPRKKMKDGSSEDTVTF